MPTRDRRQFKAAPYQNPRVFPPPDESAWIEAGIEPPLPSREVADKQPGRIYRRNKEKD